MDIKCRVVLEKSRFENYLAKRRSVPHFLHNHHAIYIPYIYIYDEYVYTITIYIKCVLCILYYIYTIHSGILRIFLMICFWGRPVCL